MLSRFLSLVFSLISLLAATGPSCAESKIGVLAGFSGLGAEYGVAYRKGIELAPQKEGYSFIFEDDQFQAAKTVSAFNKLITIDNISAAFIGDTVTAQAVAPIAKTRKIPLYVWASSAAEFRGNPVVTRLWAADEADFGYTVEDLKKRQISRIALFTWTHTYSDNWGKYIAARFPGSVQHRFDLEQSSFQAEILRALKGEFDAIGVCLNSGQIGLFARQLRQLKNQKTFFTCNFVEATADIQAAAGALDGVFFTAPKVSADFRDRYLKSNGNTDHIFSAGIAHTASLLATNQMNAEFAFPGTRRITSPEGDSYLSFPFTRYRFYGSEIQEEK